MKRFPWEWTIGLIGGFGLGLLYAWVISPIRYVDTTPNTLRSDFKDQFRTAIAASYAATHNLARAQARMALLADPDPVQELTAQAQRMLAAGEPFELVREVAGLATDLQAGTASTLSSATPAPTTGPQTPTAVTAVPSSAQDTPEIPLESATVEVVTTPVIFDTPTPRPTRTPIPTAGEPFQLVSRDEVCNPNLTDGLMQISVLDRHRHQMPGVEITVSWNGGEEDFFTGLKPEIADGYADYIMQAGVEYEVRVAQAGTPFSGFSAPSCPDSNGQTYTGGLKLIFQQP